MFRNLTLFRFSEIAGESLADLAELESALASKPLRDCGPLESFTRGFVPPFGAGNPSLTLRINAATFFALGQQEKLLPAAVLHAALAKKMHELSLSEGGRYIGSRARKRLKAELLDQMLPRAFVRPTRLDGYVDTTSGWLVLDTASRKVAEAALTHLRQALGSFPAVPLAPNNSPRLLLTTWLQQDKLPDGFDFGDECELRDPAGGAIAKCSRQQMESREIKEHLRNGKQVVRLGLVYKDRISFLLDDTLVLRKLRLLDIALDSLDEFENANLELEARWALMIGELFPLLSTLATIFGVQRPESE